MTQNANKEEKIQKKKVFLKEKFINKKFGIRINYAHLVDNFKSFYYNSGLRKVRFIVKKRSKRSSLFEDVTTRQSSLHHKL